MLTSHHVLPEPDRLTIGADGVLTGRTGQYVKVLRDLAGVYHDADAFRTAVDVRGQDQVAYRVEEHRTRRTRVRTTQSSVGRVEWPSS